MAKIPFYLVTGFLGSGKTTLLKLYLEKYSESRKIAIIQNEFAEVNVDASELRRTGKSFEILEMNNGSVFCVCLLGDFVQSLSRFIHEHHPDVLILEASGLADPISISQILSAPALKNLIWLAHTYTVVDALNFDKTLQRVRRNVHQIRVADTVIINKCDLAEKSVTEIEGQVKGINPFAKVVQACYCKIDFAEISSFRVPVKLDAGADKNSAPKPDIDSVVVKTTKKIPVKNLHLFIDELAGKTLRIKGFVQTEEGAAAVQCSFEHVEILKDSSYMEPTQLVILGEGLDQKLTRTRFEELCGRK